MAIHPYKHKFWTTVSPWILMGSVIVLFLVVAIMANETISRQKESSISLLVEKGAALIRSFEAGTRFGMRRQHLNPVLLQTLVSETAQQPDIVHIIVSDVDGTVQAHSDLARVGGLYGKSLNLPYVAGSTELNWRIVTSPKGEPIFEVFRKFSPSTPLSCMYPSQRKLRPWCPPPGRSPGPSDTETRIIFIGLDMAPIDAAIRSDMRHTMVLGLVLLLIGFAGVVVLFLLQGYRSARTSLVRIKAFSDTLVEHLPMGLVAINQQKRIASVNQAAEIILDISAPGAAGMPAEEALPRDLSVLCGHLDENSGVIETEIDCRIRDGKQVPLAVSASAMRDRNAGFLGYVLLFKDLSEIRSLRKEIARSQRLATVGRLAAGVAHEIRNPLSSIKGFATYFKERYQDVAEDQQVADIMINEVDRLNRVVGQLLEFSRPVSISKREVDIRSFIESSVKLVDQRASDAGIDIRIHPCSAVSTVIMDPDRMNQVMLNLYLNSIDAMPSGGTISISVAEDSGGNAVKFTVSDTGGGINPENLSRIFDPYFTTKNSGTGLGLAIVNNIIEAHGGEIQVDSTPGRGTVIEILLPRSPAARN